MIGDYAGIMTGGLWNLTGLGNATEVFTAGWWADEPVVPTVVTWEDLNTRRPIRINHRKERALYIRGRYRP